MGTLIFRHHAASSAPSAASIPINIFSGRCKRGNVCFIAITWLSPFLPRVYIHQYFLGGASVGISIYLLSRGFVGFLPRAYSHQYNFHGCKRGNVSFFCHHAASPHSPAAFIPIKMLLGDASVGTFYPRSPLGFPGFCMSGSPPATYTVCSPSPHILFLFTCYILYNKYNIYCMMGKAKTGEKK